jgi:hypothetical protein
VDSGAFPYGVFRRGFCTGDVLRRSICGVEVPESIVVIASNALAVKDECIACLAGQSIIVDRDECTGIQLYSAGQRDAAFLHNDQVGIYKMEPDRFCDRLAELL